MKTAHLLNWLLRITFGMALLLTLVELLPKDAFAGYSHTVGFANPVFPAPSVSSSQDEISPEVLSFIAGTYLGHTEEYPDPNETIPALQAYLDGNQLLIDGKTETAIALFKKAVSKYPEGRHVHAGLGRALLYKFRDTKNLAYLSESANEFSTAAEIGMRFGKVRYTEVVSKEWAALENLVAMDSFFEKALAIGDRVSTVHLDYALGLKYLGDIRAESHLKMAFAQSQDGNTNAMAAYAEFLLDHQRESEALAVIEKNTHMKYLHFLRGVALERLGQAGEASSEYEAYNDFSKDFPAPRRYKIENSQSQQKISFSQSEITNDAMSALLIDDLNLPDDPNVPDRKVRRRLSWLVTCEAHDESLGGMRAVGWTVRTRVFRGSAGPLSCRIGIDNDGVSVPDKYWSVMNQPSQFVLDCDKSRTPETDQTAYDVYFGYAPDPVTGYCGCGGQLVGGNVCSNAAACDFFDISCINGAPKFGPILFWSNSCPTTTPYSCATQAGFICANGGNDNCFFKRP